MSLQTHTMLFFKALHLQKMEEAAGVVVSPAAQAAYPPSPATPLRLQGSVSSPPPREFQGLIPRCWGTIAQNPLRRPLWEWLGQRTNCPWLCASLLGQWGQQSRSQPCSRHCAGSCLV